MAAAPTVVWKSVAICGSRESVTRTCAWLAKPAAASSMIERVVVFGGKRAELAAEEDKFAGLEKRMGRAVARHTDVDNHRVSSFLGRGLAKCKT
jgi:hypothetical protein